MAEDAVPSAADDSSEQERLKVYGLSKLKAEDLTVGEGETINVTLSGSGAERYKRFAHFVPVKTAADLKRLIGTPDEVAKGRCQCPEGLSEAFSGNFEKIEDLSQSQRDQLRAATNAYVYGNSETVAHYASAIEKALSLVDRSKVSIVGFLDIIVDRNAVLNVSPSVDVLLARKVIIRRGGRIRFTSPLKIDCASIEGEELFVVPFPGASALRAETTMQELSGGGSS